MDKTPSNASEFSYGYDKMLLDLLYNLTSGPLVDPGFHFEDQLDYYRRKLMGDKVSLEELNVFTEKYKRATQIMFPNSPSSIRSRTFLIRLFASFVVLHSIYQASSFEEAMNEESLLERCIFKYTFKDENSMDCYKKEVHYLYSRYTQGLVVKDYDTFCDVMSMYIDEFEQTFQNVADSSLGYKADINKDPFTILCEKYNIPESRKGLFKLQVDAAAETNVCESDFVEYYESLKYVWNNRFPNMPYSDEVREYVNEHKLPFVLTYGSQIRNIRKEIQLFEMLACVNIKIALANGARNYKQLDSIIRRETYDLAPNLRVYFADNKKKFLGYYRLDKENGSDYDKNFNTAMVPFKKELMILNELIMEEINFRNQDNTISEAKQKERKSERDINEYKFLLSEKEAEIFDLKKDLEYYENLEAQNFKTEISQYDKALTDLFQKLCDVRYGSLLNELYLISIGKLTVSEERIKAILANMFFVFSSIGINPYEISKIGKKVRFYDDEANIIYNVDDTKVKEGMNIGVVKYPGWKFKDNELILPRVEVEGGE